MDIHRCRFVPYPPSAINAVAFSYSHVPGKKSSAPIRLAIGRANGDIEIWNPLNGQWHQETILHGGKDRSIDGLVWVNEPDEVLQDGNLLVGRSRLFSIGYTSTVTEWDLEKKRPKKQASGMHGDIWCLGVQPFEIPGKRGQPSKIIQTGRRLVAGTMDGSLALYSIDDDDLRFDRILVRSPSKKTKMVSIAFQNRHIAVVGCSNSAVQVYDLRNGNLLRKMTLGSDLAGGTKEIIVWSVKCLSDGDIVSGDSTGHVCIWDGKTYSQAQRLQGHKQDVLSLAVSADGSTIVSGGMDKRTILYRKTAGSGSRWGKVWHRRYHSHDVKTLASFEGPGMSVLVSGGPDAQPIVLPLREAGMENHRTLSNLPQNTPLESAPRARMVVSWWDREVHIWRLQKPVKDIVDFAGIDSAVTKNRKLLARILIKGEANITSATINNDGSLLLVSTTSDIKAFHLRSRSESRKDELRVSKVDVPSSIAEQGATSLKVSPNGQWACVIHDGSKVSLLQLSRDSDDGDRPIIHPKAIKLNRLKRNIPKHMALGGLGYYDRSVSQVAFSPDTTMLAVADMAGYIDTWILEDSKSSTNGVTVDSEDGNSSSGDSSDSEDDDNVVLSGVRWVRNPNGSLMPKLRCAPTVLSFSDHLPSEHLSMTDRDGEVTDDYVLLAVTAQSHILALHPRIGSITPWSRRNPVARFPVEFRNIRDLVKGALWAGDRVWLYGNSFLVMLDLSKDIAEEITNPSSALVPLDGQHTKPKKRKRGADTGAGNKMTKGAAGPTKVERYDEDEVEELTLDGPDLMDTDGTSAPDDDSDSEDSEDELQGELVSRRRAEGRKGPDAPPSQGTGFWHTLKYRPILGIVPLETAEEESPGDDVVVPYANGHVRKTLEVALVERPLFETDMPDRYFAEGEFESPDIMDPLSIATAAASIVGTAIKVSKGLYDTFEALKDVPSDVRALCSTVDSVKSAVSRLVRFMNDRDSCIWPDQWLEDVTNDIEAIGDELKEVQKFMEMWDTDGKGKAGKIKDAWRSWKWYFNAEEIQRCTRRLREAREDLGLQLGIIQMSTTAQTSQDVHQVKNIVGTIRAELAQKTSTYDNQAFNIELSAFAQQMSDLQDAILSLNKPDMWPPVNGYRADEDTPLSGGRIHTPPSIADADRNSFDPFTSNPPSPILSPLAALSQEAFLQNQQLPTILAGSQENPISIAALSLKLSDMQRKYDQLTIYWDNALGQIGHLESEIDRYIAANVPDRTEDTDTKDTSPSLLQGSEEVTSREAVIDVLKAQNEVLEDMISNRVTIMGYRDDNLNARDLGKQLLKKREKVNRQQEEIDLLRWRLEGSGR
ncbi:putative Quinon protein alcohol dehydrogenase-like superfamily [Seiridium cardinale]|uniref:Quinon protein alcohol dehydrogenase-like superfamily n=1 Tax=Seiridium cardinale TaxID=138064 RepID=A0ABR2Y0V8_9PEZI